MRRFVSYAAVVMLGACVLVAGCGKESPQFPKVVITTSAGTIEAELWPDKAPVTVANFLQYVDDKHFDQTIFHRCIREFMIQGGGMNPDGAEKATREPSKTEAPNGAKNMRGTLAMARTNVVDSATAQFFINVRDNDFLNHSAPTAQGYGYAVFGQVTQGMDVADLIVNSPTVGNPQMGQPANPVVILSIRRAQ